jgi:hypothetical protein
MIGLVIANSAQLMSHALLMLWLTISRLGGFGDNNVGAMTRRVAIAAVLMGLIAYATLNLAEGLALIWRVGVPALFACIAYIVLLKLLHVDEAEHAWGLMLARLRR